MLFAHNIICGNLYDITLLPNVIIQIFNDEIAQNPYRVCL